MGNKEAPFDGMENFRGVETACRIVAVCEYAASFIEGTVGLGCIVEYGESLGGCDLVQCLHIARISIDVDGHDASSVWSDAFGNAFGVKAEGILIHIGEDHPASFPEQCREGRHVGKRGGDHLLPCQPCHMEPQLQGEGPVGAGGHVGYAETQGDALLEQVDVFAVVRQVPGIKDGVQTGLVFGPIGEQGAGDRNGRHVQVHMSPFGVAADEAVR